MIDKLETKNLKTSNNTDDIKIFRLIKSYENSWTVNDIVDFEIFDNLQDCIDARNEKLDYLFNLLTDTRNLLNKLKARWQETNDPCTFLEDSIVSLETKAKEIIENLIPAVIKNFNKYIQTV